MPLLEVMRKKLREVHYFLGHMGTVARRDVGDPEEFEFLLSALLSASISIIVFIQTRGYKIWYDTWRGKRTDNERKLLEFMHNQRNAVVHRKGANIEIVVHVVPITHIRTGGTGHPAFGFHWWGPPDTPPPDVSVNVYQFELGAHSEAFDTCRRFVEVLSELVADFEAAHPGA